MRMNKMGSNIVRQKLICKQNSEQILLHLPIRTKPKLLERNNQWVFDRTVEPNCVIKDLVRPIDPGHNIH